MRHVNVISRQGIPLLGDTTPLEAAILALFTALFSDWDNFQSVFQNLEKFYQKT